MVVVIGRVLVDGAAAGPLLRLGAPISFWGGVNPVTGKVSDPRHPDVGRSVEGTVLAIPGAVGSSSSSAVMLELIRNGVAPAAVLLDRSDAILALGVVVARELGRPTLPVVELPLESLEEVPEGTWLQVASPGRISWPGDGDTHRAGPR
jgi:predicted aconitase with swiveling domain